VLHIAGSVHMCEVGMHFKRLYLKIGHCRYDQSIYWQHLIYRTNQIKYTCCHKPKDLVQVCETSVIWSLLGICHLGVSSNAFIFISYYFVTYFQGPENIVHINK
jgi:hypothetical protein